MGPPLPPFLGAKHSQKSHFATLGQCEDLGFFYWVGEGGRRVRNRGSLVLRPQVRRQSTTYPPLISCGGGRPRPEVGLGFLGTLLWALKKRQLPVFTRRQAGPVSVGSSAIPSPSLSPPPSCLLPTLYLQHKSQSQIIIYSALFWGRNGGSMQGRVSSLLQKAVV